MHLSRDLTIEQFLNENILLPTFGIEENQLYITEDMEKEEQEEIRNIILKVREYRARIMFEEEYIFANAKNYVEMWRKTTFVGLCTYGYFHNGQAILEAYENYKHLI